MIKFSKQVVTWALGIISAVFTLVPEALFGCYKIVPGAPCEVNIIINRVLCFLAITETDIYPYAYNGKNKKSNNAS